MGKETRLVRTSESRGLSHEACCAGMMRRWYLMGNERKEKFLTDFMIEEVDM